MLWLLDVLHYAAHRGRIWRGKAPLRWVLETEDIIIHREMGWIAISVASIHNGIIPCPQNSGARSKK